MCNGASHSQLHGTVKDDVVDDDVINDVTNTVDSADEMHVATFFTTRDTDFGVVKDNIVTVDGERKISLKLFLSACEDYTLFFERFGSSNLMGTIKGDINGNIEKIRKNCQLEDYKNLPYLLVSLSTYYNM